MARKTEVYHYDNVCKYCGKHYKAKRVTSKFCSDKCRSLWTARKNRAKKLKTKKNSDENKGLQF